LWSTPFLARSLSVSLMPGVCFESAVDAVFEEVAIVEVIFVSSFVGTIWINVKKTFQFLLHLMKSRRVLSQFGVDSRTSPTIHLRPLHHHCPNHPPKNDRDDTSGDETVAGRLQCLPEEEIGDGWEHDIREHSVKRHNAGVFCNVESEIHCGWMDLVM